MEAAQKPGNGEKGQGPRARRGEAGGTERGGREAAVETQAGAAAGEAPGEGRSAPGGSQRKEAPRARYLCGRSERPRGSRVLQQLHRDLLRHRRRRCGRRLGHVALDHWREVGPGQAAGAPAVPSSAPRPRSGGRRGCAPRSPAQRAGRGRAMLKASGGGAAGRRERSGGGDGPRREGGRSGSASPGEARRRAGVTGPGPPRSSPRGSGRAAARRRGTRAGKFSKARERGLAPAAAASRGRARLSEADRLAGT